IFVLPDPAVSDIKTFDPGLSTDQPSIYAINMVFTGLVQLNEKGDVVNQLAASHSVAADGTTWTFKLRSGLKFSDGTALTSADVVYSIDRALDPALKSLVSPAYLNLVLDSDKRLAGKTKSLIGDSLLAPDPQTVIIKTNKKAAYFLDALTYSCSYVVEKSMIRKYGNNFADHLAEGIGGDGPWKVSKYQHGKDIEFVPNPYYYGQKPQLKKLIMPFYQEIPTSFNAYLANQVDESRVPAAQLNQAKALPNNQYQPVPQLWIDYYSMNYLVKPFNNIKIRQAFALALNKDEIAQNVHSGARVPTNHIVPQGMPGYDANLKGPDGTTNTSGNVTLAKQLFQQGMKEEGYTQATFPSITFTVATQGNAEERNEFAAAQQMWKTALGVTVKINDIDFNKELDAIPASTNNAKGLQMWSIAWIADYPDAQDWLTLQFDKGVPNNNDNYGQNASSNAATQQKMQTLMEQADSNLNPATRLQQYNQAEQQLVNDVAWLPVDQRTYTHVVKPCVVGYQYNNQGLYPPDSWASVYITNATPCANTSQYQ
ncbi:MAG TPA: peptide ABC transporter substrate-binding protein, partial [Ktedonobacteraceae bacterium]|nr:peptide ABC transporter substrate-binding protein [Ktedonobacteraceae bacterium]